MKSVNARNRDEFLRALEEARRAALGLGDEPTGGSERPAAVPGGGFELRKAIDSMAGMLRSYVSARLLNRLYAENATPAAGAHTGSALAPPPPKSEHDCVVDELRLTPNLTAAELLRLRREFAKLNHPDRVLPPRREQATRRMTIANSMIDEALRGKKTRTL